MGIAFAASIGGLGTIVGSPTNAIAVGLLDETIGVRISFAQWSLFGLPLVMLACRWPRGSSQGAAGGRASVRPAAARAAIDTHAPGPRPKAPGAAGRADLPGLGDPAAARAAAARRDRWTDGTIAVIAALALFLLPDGTGRPLLVWREADRAPWA
jgi:solute carrier family 13 (sodium-dependent dicarboxylate transporter), member 2/3/5